VARTYDDDIYFSPSDAPPVSLSEDEVAANMKSATINNSDTKDQQIVMSQVQRNDDGSLTINNDILQSDNDNPEYQAYDMNDQVLTESDTLLYYDDDSVKYVINNYYEDNDDFGFAYRINRFHRFNGLSPYFSYDWNYGYYDPFYSGYYGWGYDPYYSMSWGWGYPYSYYGGYYSPFSIGFGGYWGGGYGYYNGYYDGYYNGYYGTGGGFNNNYTVAKRRSTNMNLPSGGVSANNFNQGRSSNLKSSASGNNIPENGHLRTRSVGESLVSRDAKNATIIDSRRDASVSGRTRNESQIRSSDSRIQQSVRPSTTNTGSVRRSFEPSTTGRTYNQGQAVRQTQNYTPSYNKPRVVNQSNYNNNSYTRPITTQSRNSSSGSTLKSSGSGNSGSTYTQPSSSSSVRQTYRSSSTYSTGSSTTPSRSYSSPSNTNPSYSAPERNSSSSGSSYSGGSSGGSSRSSSGGSSGSSSGGSGHRR
jgi:hypothetical protein